MNLRGEPANIGRHCGANEYDISEAGVAFYSEALDDRDDLYARVAPPLIFHSECYAFVGEWYLRNLVGNLHAQQDWELFAPIEVGQKVRTRSTIVDRYHKRGRDYVVNETDILSASDGRLLVRGRTYQSFLPEGETLENFARTRTTLAIHLGVRALREIERVLVPYYGADCPVVVAYRVGWPDQMFIRGTLSDIRGKVRDEKITRTALILVGPVLGEISDFTDSALYDPAIPHVLRPKATVS